ncbi:NAD(P)-binding protein [Lasiosphaeria ovina]|uniref:NAD(P)-binding protein n=1 Tax=Lasiosphaeria ovina TaxID=92902 RepID=A0AAE0KHZ8_9PEZI|nr:NAD(P)-binding protein [Lasiosphaeria ovina]
MAEDKKLICVVGATGNQGGSVARRFLADPRFAVRGLTRNPNSAASQALTALGAEMVRADLDDAAAVAAAFAGANVVFSVTQYWEPFFRPDCRAAAAAAAGVSCRRYAYDVELRHGKNIADAAASVEAGLDANGFLVSTLSHAGKCSAGAFTDLYHFDAKADVFPDYLASAHPALAAKTSYIQTGFFMTSHRILPESYFQKQPDGSFEMRLPIAADRAVPHLDVNADMGAFVHGVAQMPAAGGHYMAAGTVAGFGEYLRLWAAAAGVAPVAAAYKHVAFDDMVADTADRECGVEVALMFQYAADHGYDGGMDLLTAEDIRKAGIECPMTTLEEWMARQDWADVLAK